MQKKITLKFPAVLNKLSENRLLASIPKIHLRQIYWDDLQEGDSVTLQVDLDPKIGYIYALISGDHNPLNYDPSYSKGFSDPTIQCKVLVPGTLLLAFISAVGGYYLTGENIYLEKKKEAHFYLPLSFDVKTIFIKGEIARKYSQVVKGKERYYVEIPEMVFVKKEGKMVKAAETVAIAGVLKKARPKNQEKSKLIPKVRLKFPEFFFQFTDQELKQDLHVLPKKREFEINDSVEISLKVIHKAILYYALISGDYNPLHTDPIYARNLKAFEGKNIAHGALLSAWYSSGVQTLLGPGYRLVKKEEGIYKRAVKVGDNILIQLRICNKYIQEIYGTQSPFAKIEEKLFVKEDSARLIEAARSSSLYQLYY